MVDFPLNLETSKSAGQRRTRLVPERQNAISLVLPIALFDDGGVTRIADGIDGFGCHGDVVVGIGAGRKMQQFVSSSG